MPKSGPGQFNEDKCQLRASQRDDLTSTLVGQDQSTPKTICFWIMENIETVPPEKLVDAISRAIAMSMLKGRKAAD